MRNDRRVQGRSPRGSSLGNSQRIGNTEKNEEEEKAVERCIYTDCRLGPIEHRPELAVVRFTAGFAQRVKMGHFFKECLTFQDGRKHKFAHYECCWEAGLRMEHLSSDRCVLGCDGNYACWRNADLVDDNGLYKPTKPPEWRCEPSGCLHVENGHFEPVKRGLFLRFEPRQSGIVHFACARAVWGWLRLSD